MALSQAQILSEAVVGYQINSAETSSAVMPSDFSIPNSDAAGCVLPARYGASSTNSDNSVQLANAYKVAAAAGVPVDLSEIYPLTNTVTIPNNVATIGHGPAVSGFDGSAATLGTAVGLIECAGPAYNTLPALSTNPNAGDIQLLFSSAPTVAVGDVIVLFDGTASSYSGFRSYYYAGEACRVVNVSGTTVTLQKGLYAAYTASALTVLQLTPTHNNLTDLSIKVSATTTGYALRMDRIVNFELDGVQGLGSVNSAIAFFNCFDYELRKTDGLGAYATVSSGENYGIIHANCQDGRVFGGDFYAARHGIAHGGGDFTGAIPCRNIRNIGCTIKGGVIGDTNGGVANFHGNVEYCFFDECTIFGAVMPGGNHNGARNSTFIVSPVLAGLTNNATAVYASEMSGFDFDLSGSTINAPGAATASPIINFIGSSAPAQAFNAYTTSGGTINLDNVIINAPNLAYRAIIVRNNGAVQEFGVSCRGLKANAPGATYLVDATTGSGNDIQWIDLTDCGFIGSLPASTIPVELLPTAVAKKGLTQAAITPVTITSGTSSATLAVTFPRSYQSGAPIVCDCDKALNGTGVYVVHATSRAATGFTIEIVLAGGGNFTNNDTVNVSWRTGFAVGQ